MSDIDITYSIIDVLWPDFDQMAKIFMEKNGFKKKYTYREKFQDVNYDNIFPEKCQIIVRFDKRDIYCRLYMPLTGDDIGSIYADVTDKGSLFDTPSYVPIDFSAFEPYIKLGFNCEYCFSPTGERKIVINENEYNVCSRCYTQIQNVLTSVLTRTMPR